KYEDYKAVSPRLSILVYLLYSNAVKHPNFLSIKIVEIFIARVHCHLDIRGVKHEYSRLSYGFKANTAHGDS
ncbi:MAG TPA: hypothetical protein VH878_03005, partial [Thermodesulfobacteriota bacterium]